VNVTKALWQLLMDDPAELDCEECFAVMEYFAELLQQGGRGLLPEIKKRLAHCPSCHLEHRMALQRLVSGANGSNGSGGRQNEGE
jgi:hypothetical protein